ncbi:DUF262 domain-containing protein [Natranaeroarchaeum sulfidigenes]|uniref:ParB-like nuclease domain containing protein fused to HNH nuclease n=1 Tax=Natranaeroarchaeum sulfidigenes TaxID=2784880 RepID=A0A897MQK3_9EURY|nr:DUF262 domain-containing protein [Natranaeroarchaeum sulfidigenes]QSG02817.1 ParB-like nuclease domain containing protein fused to HNH nuclease [Natranaeroarchaeum sulfidigenes]
MSAENADSEDSLPDIASHIIDLESDEDSESYSIDIQTEIRENGIQNLESLDYRDLAKRLDEDLMKISRSFFGKLMTNSILKIPKFQRDYSWDVENHEQFWYSLRNQAETINSASNKRNALTESFLGTIYIAEEDDSSSSFQVIDGQQRLATTSIILNTLRRKIEKESKNLNDAEETFAEFLRKQIISRCIYEDSGSEGRSNKLSIKMRGHDHDYFRIIFDDSATRILSIANEMREPSGQGIKISTIFEKLGRDTETIDEDNLERLGLELSDTKYYAHRGSHNRLFKAKNYYDEAIDRFLSEVISLNEDQHMQRIYAMLNLAIILMRGFQVIQVRLTTSVKPETKVQIFQSLNETGKNLTVSEKIRARIVAQFGFEADEVDSWEEINRLLSDHTVDTEEYLIDYLIATSEKPDNKSKVGKRVLDAFSISERPSAYMPSRIEDKEEGERFISHLEESSQRYIDLTKHKQLDNQYFQADDDDVSSEELNELHARISQYLQRLTGEQWVPFQLLLYNELASGDSDVDPSVLVTMLDVTENIMLRYSLTNARATAIDTTFTTSCVNYNRKKIPNDIRDHLGYSESDSFSSVDTDLLTELLLHSTKLEQISRAELEQALLYKSAWPNLQPLLLRISRENMRNAEDAGRRSTESSIKLRQEELQEEHILPQTPKLSDSDNEKAWLEYFLSHPREDAGNSNGSIEDRDLGDEAIESEGILPNWLSGDDIDQCNLDDEGDLIFSRITERFIEDAGNRMLINGTVNNRIKNSPFSLKLAFYYLSSYKDLDDMGEFLANLDNIEATEEEFVRLIVEFSELGELSDGELEFLLYQVSDIFGKSKGWVKDNTEEDPIMDWDLIEPEGLEDRFDTAADFLQHFDIDEDEHESFYEVNWENMEPIIDDQRLIFQKMIENEGDNENKAGRTDDNQPLKVAYGDFRTNLVESILLKIKREGDLSDVANEYPTVHVFNQKWNWKRLAERKAHLVEETLDSLNFRTRDIPREDIDRDDAFEQIYESLNR